MTGAVVGIAMLALAAPAGAAPGTRRARFTARSSATLEYSKKTGQWQGKISVDARDLPPGDYMYVVIKASGPPGYETGGGMAIVCHFEIEANSKGKETCKGSAGTFGGPEWGERNRALVFDTSDNSGVLEADLR